MKNHYSLFSKSWLRVGLVTACAVSSSLNLQAQTGPAKLWDKSFGGSGNDGLSILKQTSDGGFILGGGSDSGINGDKSQVSNGAADFWLVKTDANGTKSWDKTFGGSADESFRTMIQTADGGYIIGGYSNSGLSGDKSQASKGGFDYWVIKVDASGTKVWDKTFGGSGDEKLFSVQQTADGGYILGGASVSGISGDKTEASKGLGDYWIVKLDATGTKIWDKTLGGSALDDLISLQQTVDGGYILGGTSASGISGDKSQASKGLIDFWVIKLDASGTKTWDKTLGGSGDDAGYINIQQTADGGYFIGGSSASGISGDKSQVSKGGNDFWVVKLDATGAKTWDKTLGGSGVDNPRSLQQTADGGYILGGTSDSPLSGDKSQASKGGNDYWVVKLDATGTKTWDKTLGTSGVEAFNSLRQTADGGFVVGGYSDTGINGDKSQASNGGNDYWVVKLAAPVPNDVAVTAISTLNSGCGLTGQEIVTIIVTNNGTAPQSNIPVSFSTNGTTWISEVIPGPLQPGASITYTFTAKANLSTPGTYNFQARTQLTGDAYPANDAFTKVVDALPTITSYPYTEGFESNDGGWKASGTNSTWALGTPAKITINAAASGTKAWVTSLTGQYALNEKSQVTGPCFNLSTLVKPVITMKIWWKSETSYDGAVLQSSIDGGATWQNVGAKGDPNNWFNDATINGAPGGQVAASAQGWTGNSATSSPPASGGWVLAKHDLTGLGGQANVRLRIAFGSETANTDEGFAFDDISIFETPAKDVGVSAINTIASGCGLSNQQTITVTLRNFGIAAQSNIPVTYTLNNGTPVTETFAGPLNVGATAPFSFTTKADLSAPGFYTIKVCTALPADAEAANDCSTITLNSLPTISTFPYNQDFEGTAYTGWLASGTNSTWALGTPAKAVINTAGSGTNSWVTGLTGGYNINEQSQVISPCFNFSTLQKPLLEMKVWWSSQTSFDGAVLQTSTDNGQNWTNVGAFGETGWYNDNSINAGPGGQPAGTTSIAEGWSGTAAASSGGWITVKHALPGLQLKPNVRLRIAFGSDASTQGDGFAFDDVKVYDTPANDVGVIGITQLASGCGLSNAQTITITVRNFGLATQTTVPVSYSLDGTNFTTETITNISLAPNGTHTYSFVTPANLSVAGVYNFTACTKLTGDGDATNDCKSQVVRSIPTITSYPYFQDFETNDGGWVASGTNSSWALGTPNKAVIKGAASGTKAFATNLTGSYNNSENSVVLGPCFNFSTLTNPQIEMKVWWNAEFSMDGAVLQASTDNGVTWNNIGFKGDPNNWFNDASISGAPGGQPAATAEGWTGHQAATASNGWVRVRHALSGLGAQTNVKLRIAFGSNTTTVNDGFAFDDILVYEKPATDALVTSISSFNSGCGVGQETVNIFVENAGTTPITGLVVKFQVTPQFGAPLTAVTDTIPGTIAPGGTQAFTFHPGKANLSNGGINTVTAGTLLTGDQIPQNDATSVTQETIPTVTTYPYIQNFENGDGGWKASGTNSSWAFGTPAKAKIKGAASGTKAWVTNLTGTYSVSENSRVLGPCFNFSTLVDPVIEMKIWWQSESSYDGAVLQSSVDGGTTWKNVGAMNSPNSQNWYNDATINGAPGGQAAATAQGWTGDTGIPAGSNGWVLAKHALTGLGGYADVKLRIAFGSETVGQYDGFAFDDITIREASNNVAVTAFAPFTKICGFGTTETVTVTVKNLSSVALANFPVNLFLNGNAIGTPQTVTALAGNASQDLVFTGINLSASGQLTLRADAVLAADPEQANNSMSTTVTNSLFTSIPQGFNFETSGQGVTALRAVTGTKSAITESAAASSSLTAGSTKGIVMDATTGSPWTLPILTVDPWANNLNNKSGVFMCLPAQPAADSLWLLFDLKQTFKTASANTNFRVTVNGTMVGTTMRPPVDGTPDVWKTVKVNLRTVKDQPMQIGLESSTSEAYNNGAGTANLVDNIIIRSRVITGTKNDILQGQLSVFPNPSKGQFNVSLPEGKAYELEVVDLTGRTLKRQLVKGGNTQLDLQGASQGIYLLKVKTQNATAIRKLIIE